MLKLYASPGACSLASHIVLEEAGLPYALQVVDARAGETRTEAYARINPLQRVPALDTGEGVLTETVAILTWLAERASPRLLPEPGGLEHARAHEWMALLSATLHPSFRMVFRAERFARTPEGVEEVRGAALETLLDLLQMIDGRLAGQTFALGRDYSVCDPYLFVFYTWARRAPVAPVCPPLLNWEAHARRVYDRSAVRRAMEQEGLSPL